MEIEEIEEITKRIEVIDGDKVYVLDKSMQTGLNILRKIADREKNNVVFVHLKKDIKFICSHQNFAIAFRPTHTSIVRWIPCLIYKYAGEWRRVVIQYANCSRCNWTGTIANPTEPDLYITLENRFEVMRQMAQLCYCRCPRCGGGLSSRGIWMEDDDYED